MKLWDLITSLNGLIYFLKDTVVEKEWHNEKVEQASSDHPPILLAFLKSKAVMHTVCVWQYFWTS